MRGNIFWSDKNLIYFCQLSYFSDWLVFYGTSTKDRSICANLPGGAMLQPNTMQICLKVSLIRLLEFYVKPGTN